MVLCLPYGSLRRVFLKNSVFSKFARDQQGIIDPNLKPDESMQPSCVTLFERRRHRLGAGDPQESLNTSKTLSRDLQHLLRVEWVQICLYAKQPYMPILSIIIPSSTFEVNIHLN